MGDEERNKMQKRSVKSSTARRVQQDASTQTDDHEASKNLIIVNFLPNKIKSWKLFEIFSPFGTISKIDFVSNPDEYGDSFARIEFSSEDESLRVWDAAQMGALEYEGEKLVVTRLSKQESPIEKLNEDCLRHIFSYILECTERLELEEVCKRWRKIGENWSDVSTLTYHDPMFVNTCKKLSLVLQRCHKSLRNIDVGEWNVKYEYLKKIAEKCDGISTIKMYMVEENSWKALQEMFRSNPNLLRVFILLHDNNINLAEKLRHWPPEMAEIHIDTDIDSYRIIDYYINLTQFQSLLAFGLYRTILRQGDLRGLELLRNLSGLYVNNSKIPLSYLSRWRDFQALEHLGLQNVKINDDLLSQIVLKNPNLKSLDISVIDGITDESFDFVALLPKLEKLLMSHLELVTGYGIKNLRTLKILDIGGCVNIDKWAVCQLIDSASSLHTIGASGLPESTILHLLHHTQASVNLGNCHPKLSISPGTDVARSWHASDHHRGEWEVLYESPKNLEHDFPGWYKTSTVIQ